MFHSSRSSCSSFPSNPINQLPTSATIPFIQSHQYIHCNPNDARFDPFTTIFGAFASRFDPFIATSFASIFCACDARLDPCHSSPRHSLQYSVHSLHTLINICRYIESRNRLHICELLSATFHAPSLATD